MALLCYDNGKQLVVDLLCYSVSGLSVFILLNPDMLVVLAAHYCQFSSIIPGVNCVSHLNKGVKVPQPSNTSSALWVRILTTV